jgi:hypothetical protein
MFIVTSLDRRAPMPLSLARNVAMQRASYVAFGRAEDSRSGQPSRFPWLRAIV